MLQRSVGRLADSELLPTALRAVCGYYARAGVFDYESLQLKRRVDEVVDGMIDDAFGVVEQEIADAFGHEYVAFEYDTKLVLPAKLTLGYLYRNAEPTEHGRAEAMTRLVVEALLDGDMRDAINDDEFGDFDVDFEITERERREIATIAQETLQSRVQPRFERFADPVREAYESAVDISERHQRQDPAFRRLMSRAQEGDRSAFEEIRREYKTASFAEPPSLLTARERELPYIKTQYDRVGVIYDAMVDMYRGAGLTVEDTFKRSVVLAIIGAQIWLDDVDDYRADMADGQLTPVTAEYLLCETETAARESVIEISETYLDRARAEATAVDSALTGIATEYIYRNGTPEMLPGGR